jgi:DNA modification methylase
VRENSIAVSTAARLADLPPERQREVALSNNPSAAAKTISREIDRERRQAEQAKIDRERAACATHRPTIEKRDSLGFISTIAPGSVDLLITDPPYSTDVDNIDTFARWIVQALCMLKPTGRAYVCIGAYAAEMLAYLKALSDAGSLTRTEILVWSYRNRIGPKPTHEYIRNWQAILHIRNTEAAALACHALIDQFAVQEINAPDGRAGDHWHAWQKPDALADLLISHSTKPNDLVVDPFAGTGTFLLAAARAGCAALGCDVDEGMLATAVKRGCVYA